MSKVLILGASSNIGTSIINACLDRNDEVIATYNKRPIEVKHHNNLKLMPFDIQYGVPTFILKLDKIDTVISLIGLMLGKSLNDYKDYEIDKMMSINFSAQAKCLRDLIPHMNNDSQVILTSSASGQRGSYDPIYAAAKASIFGFTKAMALSCAPNTRFNCVAPGPSEGTTMWNDMIEDRKAYHKSKSLTGELLQAEDLGKIIVDITRPHWRNLNGACIDLNGGTYLR